MEELRTMYNSLIDRRFDDELISPSFEEFEKYHQGFRKPEEFEEDDSIHVMPNKPTMSDIRDVVLNNRPSADPSEFIRAKYPWLRMSILACIELFKIYRYMTGSGSITPLLIFELILIFNVIMYLKRHL